MKRQHTPVTYEESVANAPQEQFVHTGYETWVGPEALAKINLERISLADDVVRIKRIIAGESYGRGNSLLGKLLKKG